jgi:hypothetical protein
LPWRPMAVVYYIARANVLWGMYMRFVAVCGHAAGHRKYIPPIKPLPDHALACSRVGVKQHACLRTVLLLAAARRHSAGLLLQCGAARWGCDDHINW